MHLAICANLDVCLRAVVGLSFYIVVSTFSDLIVI